MKNNLTYQTDSDKYHRDMDDIKKEVRQVLIRLPLDVYDVLDADAERCSRNITKQVEAILKTYYGIESVELDSQRLDSTRAQVSPNYRAQSSGKPDDRQASEKKKRNNTHLAVATAKTTQDEWRELCKLSGENLPIDAIVMYNLYRKRGDERFLTDYPDHIQKLVTAYKEGRIKAFLSENQLTEEKTAG
jgi:hypothetical protein